MNINGFDKEKEIVPIVSNYNNNNGIPKKQKYILIILTSIILLITLLSLVLVLSLRKSKKRTTKINKQELNIRPPLIINSTSGNHTHTFIFMPGMTNTPEDFEPVFTGNRIHFDKKNDTTFILLRSPLTYITYFDSKNYSWFDIYNFPLKDDSDYNFNELKQSAKILEKFIENEANALGGKYENIIIGGHSQGACISLYQGYNSEKKLGGIVSFSGVLPPGNINLDKNDLNVYFGYGDKDNIILPSFFNESIQRIKDFEGFKLYVYKDHLHFINLDETDDASEFLNEIIK